MSYNTLNAVKRVVKSILIFCLLTSALAVAQRQSIVVLPTIADSEVKLSPKELEILTEKVRSIIPQILPLKDFNLLKQDAVLERLGAEGLFAACKEGSCVGDLVARVQADFGARCEVISANKQLYLKFELYGTLRGEKDAGTIDLFNDPVKDFNEMLALLDKKVPVALKKIVAEVIPTPAAPAVGGNVVAQITTEPSGATLEINGIPYPGCSKTPCVISLYENRFKLSASLNEYKTADTNLVITMPNQLVNIKLMPIPNYGTLRVNPSYVRGIGKDEEWILYVNGKELPSYKSNLTPGRYTLKLTHDCYDDVYASVDIEKGKLYPFDIAGHGAHLKSDETCSEAYVEDYREKPDVDFDYSEANKNSGSSFWVALALDVIGVVAIGYGYIKDVEANDNYREYKHSAVQSNIDATWQKVDDARVARNVSYVVGGLFLAAGIGVHIWF